MNVIGPAVLPCPLKCDVPEGVTLAEVPPSRHDWSDVIRCPNEGCDRTWFVVEAPGLARTT